MSKPRLGMAAAGIALVALTMLPDVAEAGFRLRVGGPLGVARFAVAHVLGVAGIRHMRMAARGRTRMAALRPQDLRSATEAVRPTVRAQLTAVAALAGWRGGRAEQGWWQHADGTYGWVGPLFWPFADDDVTDFTMRGDGTALWSYGYGDIYAAVFAPYAPTELAAYTAPGRRHRRVPELQQLCDTGDAVGLPIDAMLRTVQPNEVQRAGLDELASAWAAAGASIRASCPTEAAGNALDRFALMQRRLDAMINAVDAVAPQLAKFYGLLDDEQKSRLNALGKDGRANAAETKRKEMQAAACKAPSEPASDEQLQRQYEQLVKQQWPVDEIATALRLDDTRRAALEVLQDTTMGTMEALSPCPPQNLHTPQARLKAVKARLEMMREATKSVGDALDDFEWGLTDEQKTQFEAMGLKRGV
ncbi:Spy/CpxP family protein refolding chaperone [Bradyrhizobium iriomotense]|nr:Spy/CpxP family protein refolding chaperone [Bradyrhizobium iriomotense]